MVGGAQALFDSAVEYAKMRVQFGRTIGSFQAIKHKCADMLLDVESARSAAYCAAAAAAEEDPEASALASPGQGRALRNLSCDRGRDHPDPRRYRFHLGERHPPLVQAGKEFRGAARRSHHAPRTLMQRWGY